jgi:hypothetical protein
LRKSFPDGIRNVAQESYFNDIPKEAIPPVIAATEADLQIVEKAFSRIEDYFNRAVDEVLKLQDDTPISLEQRADMSVFIAIQLLRTRAYRNLIVEAAEKFVLALCADAVKENFGEEALKYLPKVTYKDKAAGLIQHKQIFDFARLDKVARVLRNHIWMIGINDTTHPLYTSDNPVVMHTELKDQLIGVGIASPGIEIAFPLSSKRILLLADRMIFCPHESAFDGLSRSLDPSNVEYYNSLQVIHSERQLFCEKPDFALAEDMIKKSPTLGQPPRERVDVRIVNCSTPQPSNRSFQMSRERVDVRIVNCSPDEKKRGDA